MFNNLALWGDKKFVSELKRTYKFQRGVNNRLDCHANQTRILSKEYSFVAGDYVRSTARNDVKRHTEDNSPKYRMVGKMKGNNFTDKVHSLFSTHHSLKRAGATHVALCESVGSYFRHWCGAFTLAEVLITLGIIGVVAALTLPSLVQNYRKSVVENKLKASYSIISNAVKMAEVENGMGFDFTISDEYKDENDVNNFSAKQSEAIFNTYFKSYFKVVKEYSKKDNNKFDYYGQKGGKIDDVAVTGKCFELTNGTAMCFVARGGAVGHFYVYLNPEKEKKVAGSDVFAFRLDKSRGAYWSYGLTNVSTGLSRQLLLDGCSNVYDHALTPDWSRPDICTYLIQLNGWKIPNDYPVRL